MGTRRKIPTGGARQQLQRCADLLAVLPRKGDGTANRLIIKASYHIIERRN